MTRRSNQEAEIRPDLQNGIELLDRVAHELRGPAGVTLGALEELEQALGDKAREHALLLEMAQRGVKKILRTAERLTRLSRLEASTPTLTLAPTDIAALLRASAQEAVFLEGRRNVTLETTLPAATCIGVADAMWLRVAVSELLSQALRTARKKVILELSRAEHDVRLTIRDDGALGHRAALLDAPPPTDVPSTGGPASRSDAAFSLGLAKRIAALHECPLELRSVAPEGLEVLWTLPAAS